ncbi:ATP-binding protein [Actinoplanes sp. NPDC051475]|uniref:sensor histidine kinase n=1 Tax=Actinoplanes sp. NPDC051475 TaxID=3157225 RepID=UPI00344E7BAC
MPPITTTSAVRRRAAALWGRLPLRIRLVAGFAAAMLLVLTAAGAFVYLRVQYALDLRLNEDLAEQSAQLRAAATTSAGPRDAPLLPHGQYYQLLDTSNRVLASAPGLPRPSLLRPAELRTALRAPLREDRGELLPISDRPLRLLAVPLHPGATTATGPAVALVAVRRDQRDEALRELIGQLALAQLAALAVASLVGYRLARAALVPVERYRTQAAQIAAGATGVRLSVPPGSHDEVARLGRTLNDMLTALETALERERRFVADASHELRTPLTLLSTELELALRRTRSTTELEDVVRRAAADTQDLINLADTLLRVGTPADPARVADTSVDVTELLATITDRYRATTAGRLLHVQVAPGLLVHGDAAALGQTLTNLFDNAVRHGAGPITVHADTLGAAVRIVVHDEGPGIEPGFLPHATERFTRADTARTTPGTGLGLSLVDAIVTAHHGELRICSRGLHHRTARRFDHDCEHPTSGTTITVLISSSC